MIIVIGGNLTQQNNVYSFTEAIKTEPNFQPNIKYNTRKDLLLIPYSSGTTGIPKGVQLTHFNISAVIAGSLNGQK
jgi:long-subunit acyl-CoA synthetase (AMP-forming)